MSLYRSMDYRAIISDLVRERKAKNPKFGFSNLAEAIGVQKTYVSRVLGGERDFSSDQLHAIARYFELDTRAQEYLLLLLEYARTGLAWRKRDLQRQIGHIQVEQRNIAKTLKAEVLNPEASVLSAYYLDPLHVVVHQFFSIPAYQKDPLRIARALGLAPEPFSRVIKALESAELIRRNARTGAYTLLKEHIHLEKDSPLSLPHLMAFRHLSAQHLARLARDEKFSFSVTLTTNEKTRTFIHERFLAFLKEIEPVVRDSPSEEVYQINFDLFPWTQTLGQG